MLKQVWTTVEVPLKKICSVKEYKHVGDNYVLSNLWQQFGEGPHISVVVRC